MNKKKLPLKANKATKDKVVEKDNKHQEKLMELINDLPTLNKIKQNEKKEVPTVENKTGSDWLEEQVTRLSEENEKLKKDLALYKEQYNTLLIERPNNNPAMFISPKEETIKKEIVNLFRELENNYLGRNPQNQKYINVKIEHVLKRMNSMFSFLKPS